MNVPPELLLEISRHLFPLDLLMLSRVSKAFRGTLLRRSSIAVWQEAERNIGGLPLCPRNLCEPSCAALLYLKECTICSQGTLNIPDLLLLKRLCTKCRRECLIAPLGTQARYELQSMARGYRFSDFLPSNRTGEFLVSDADATKAKYAEIEATECWERLDAWAEECRELKGERLEFDRRLGPWLENKRRERETELARRMGANLEKVKNRLRTLGWSRVDIDATSHLTGHRAFRSFCATEQLEDEDWEETLPKLLESLEKTRQRRLLAEALERKRDREYILKDWLWNQLEVLIRSVPIPQTMSGLSNSGPTSTSTVDSNGRSQSHRDGSSLTVSFPCTAYLLGWPQFQALLETDAPAEVLKSKLVAQNNELLQLVNKWRTNLESKLVQMMPKDTLPIDDKITGLHLMAGSIGRPQPISQLDLKIRKLLRADAIFMGTGTSQTLNTYPEDFYAKNSHGLHYYVEAAELAKSLLRCLQRHNASYLEMKIMGETFLCGRCYGSPVPRTWKGLLGHYLDEKVRHENTRGRFNTQNDQGIAYIFDHDITRIDPNKPLVRIKDQNTGTSSAPFSNGAYYCKICIKALGLYKFNFKSAVIDGENNIREHVQNVHLIKYPELKKHYVSAGQSA